MAVPKRRTSHARQGKRRSHQHLKPIQVQYCSRCEQPVLPHRVCPNCGYLPGPRGRGRWKRRSNPCDRAGRDGRRPRPGSDRRRGRAGRRRRPGPARRPRRRPGPGRAAASPGRRRRRDRLEIFHCTQVIGMEETPVRGPAQEAGQLHQPLLAAARRAARSTPSSAPATPGPWWPAACACAGSSRASAGPASPPCMPTLRGPVRPARRRRQRQPQGRAPVPVRRDGQHLRPAHPSDASGRPSA